MDKINIFDTKKDNDIKKPEENVNDKNPEQTKKVKQPVKELAFEGCYSVVEKSKAQLKIINRKDAVGNKTDKLSLQMREPRSYKKTWDDPDNLEFVNLQEASVYFDVNAPNIDMMVARPDRLFVLAHVNLSKAGINESSHVDVITDSEYLVYLSDGSDSIDVKSKLLDDVKDTSSATNNIEQKKAKKKNIIKHIPNKPHANIIYKVKCGKKR